MEIVLTPDQFEKFIIKEGFDSRDKGAFEKVLNRNMPKKFLWWKKMQIIEMKEYPMDLPFRPGEWLPPPSILYIKGLIIVDKDWAMKQWDFLNSTIPYPENEKVRLGDLVSTGYANKIREAVASLYEVITSVRPEEVRMWDDVIVKFYDLNEEKKESGEKWIKCNNCNKKFTQTIHKGKKSLPICPHCGTHVQDKKDRLSEDSRLKFLKRRLSPEILLEFLPEALEFGKSRVRKTRAKISGDYLPKFRSMVVGFLFDAFWDRIPGNVQHEKYFDEFLWDYLHKTFYDEIEQAFVEVMNEPYDRNL